jgi:hypothetical protein
LGLDRASPGSLPGPGSVAMNLPRQAKPLASGAILRQLKCGVPVKAEIKHHLDRFSAWYRLVRWLAWVQAALFIGVALLALAVVLDKLLFLQLEAGFLAELLGYLTALTLLVAWFALRRQPRYVAYLVDRALGLKNLLGTALEGDGREDEMAGLLRQRAVAALQGVPAHRPFPVRFTWLGRWLALPVVVLALAWWLPPRDWLGRRAEFARRQMESKQVEQATFVLQEKVNEVNQVLKRYESVTGKQVTQDLKALEQDLQGAGKAEALVKMGELASKYRDDFEQAKQFSEATRTLSEPLDLASLDGANRDLLQGLQESLQKGDMQKAAEALREVAKRLQDPALSPEQREALAKQAGKIAEQLKSAAQSSQQASKKQAGQGQSGPQQANQDGQAQQQQQPGDQSQPNQGGQQQAGQQSQQAADAAQQLAQALQQMPGGQMSPQSAQQMAQAADQLADAMESFASMDQMRQGLESARQEMVGEGFQNFDVPSIESMMQQEAESYASLGEGQGEGEGEGAGQGQRGHGKGGTGGEGIGKGGIPPESQSNTAFTDKKSESRLGEGAILNQIFVQGLPEKGEFPEAYTSAALAAKQDAAGALARNRVPREYEEMVKGYFDSLTPAPSQDPP